MKAFYQEQELPDGSVLAGVVLQEDALPHEMLIPCRTIEDAEALLAGFDTFSLVEVVEPE